MSTMAPRNNSRTTPPPPQSSSTSSLSSQAAAAAAAAALMSSPSSSSAMSSSSISVERAIEFNNAGVHVAAAGYPRVAWELFKGALEVKLAVERYVAAAAASATAAAASTPASSATADATATVSDRRHHQQQLGHGGDKLLREPQQRQEAPTPPPPFPSNVFIEQAECHMDRIETYLLNPIPWHHRNNLPHVDIVAPTRIGNSNSANRRRSNGSSNNNNNNLDDVAAANRDSSWYAATSTPTFTPSILHFSASPTSSIAMPASDVRLHYSPRLLTKPLLLEAPSNDPLVRAVRSGKESATIIFNLALLDHLNYTVSEQAIELYELALSLVRAGIDEFDILSISLLNNIGVWSYENGDIDGAEACMFQLVSILQHQHQQQLHLQMQQQHLHLAHNAGISTEAVHSSGLAQIHDSESRTPGPHLVVARHIPQLLEPNEQALLESNIIWFMNPFYEASPAA